MPEKYMDLPGKSRRDKGVPAGAGRNRIDGIKSKLTTAVGHAIVQLIEAWTIADSLDMNIARYLTEELIKLEMDTIIEPPGEDQSVEKWSLAAKELVLDELVSLLEISGNVVNRTKLLLDFVNREKKATTGIGKGIAIPHVRSMQAREFTMGFARSSAGYPFNSMDGEPAHFFFVMAAPPYEDDLYLKVFKELSEMMQYEGVRQEIMEMTHPGELLRIVRQYE